MLFSVNCSDLDKQQQIQKQKTKTKSIFSFLKALLDNGAFKTSKTVRNSYALLYMCEIAV
jgi:hypothetical protein